MKLQAALQYLMTYGWAILVIAIVVAALAALGVFSVSPFGNNCIFSEGFSCSSMTISSTGVASFMLVNGYSYPVNVTAVGCNSNLTVAHMQRVTSTLSNSIYLTVDSSAPFNVQCWTGGSTFSGHLNAPFTGYIVVNYTSQYVGVNQIAYGKLSSKISTGTATTTTATTTTSSSTSTATVSTTSTTSSTTIG